MKGFARSQRSACPSGRAAEVLSSAEPELYDVSPAGQPVLRGGTCTACGYVMFPMQRYGCEQCGAFGDAIETTPLSGRGVVRASVMVYRLDNEDLPTPFVLAEVRLDEGPVVRAVCAGDQVIDGDTLVRATGTARNDQSIEIRFVEENR